MKITAFNPVIFTKNAAETVRLFEELGFEVKHNKTGINGGEVSSMEDANGFRVDIAQPVDIPFVQDTACIRMNVRNFDEAYELLTLKGFKNVQGDKLIRTGTSKATMMVSPSGLTISLIEHIRKDD